LAVNGRPITRLAAGRSWSTVRVKVPAIVLREGINRLRVSWPLPTAPPADQVREATRKLARGENDALLQIFGELHLLTVVAGELEAASDWDTGRYIVPKSRRRSSAGELLETTVAAFSSGNSDS
jgi:hypothetical protein